MTDLRQSNNRGESMIIAVIIMFLFLLIGVSVITASATAMGAVNQRIADRQLYYYARSGLDESLQYGKLGQKLRDDTLAQLLASGQEEITFSHTLTPAVSSPASQAPIHDLTIDYAGTASVLKRDDQGQPQEYLIAMDDVSLCFTTDYRNQQYVMKVSYSCRFWAIREEGEWRWDATWTVKEVGQP